jgi:hypothetical protein
MKKAIVIAIIFISSTVYACPEVKEYAVKNGVVCAAQKSYCTEFDCTDGYFDSYGDYIDGYCNTCTTVYKCTDEKEFNCYWRIVGWNEPCAGT